MTRAGPGDLRWLAAIPLVNFVVVAIYDVRHGALAELLWVCNASALLLGLGVLWSRPIWVKAATVWLFVGALPFVADVLRTGELLPHSVVTHFVCPIVGTAYLRRTEHPTGRVWWAALALLVALQVLARLLSPRELNINASFEVHPLMTGLFTSYLAYWVAHFVLFGVALFLVEYVLDRTAFRRIRA